VFLFFLKIFFIINNKKKVKIKKTKNKPSINYFKLFHFLILKLIITLIQTLHFFITFFKLIIVPPAIYPSLARFYYLYLLQEKYLLIFTTSLFYKITSLLTITTIKKNIKISTNNHIFHKLSLFPQTNLIPTNKHSSHK